MNDLGDYYKILDIAPEANQEEIKQSYRDLAQIWHPDKYENSNERIKKKAEENFREITLAYQTIISSQPEIRNENDGPGASKAQPNTSKQRKRANSETYDSRKETKSKNQRKRAKGKEQIGSHMNHGRRPNPSKIMIQMTGKAIWVLVILIFIYLWNQFNLAQVFAWAFILFLVLTWWNMSFKGASNFVDNFGRRFGLVDKDEYKPNVFGIVVIFILACLIFALILYVVPRFMTNTPDHPGRYP